MRDWPYPFWIAHRGAGMLAPENTLAAFRAGAAYGYRSFECDVQLSSDGVPFLMHDARLERTTCAEGVAGEKPWSVLARMDAGSRHSRTYAGEPLPSLEAVARYVRRNGFALNIEIKAEPAAAAHVGLRVAQEVSRMWQGDPFPPLLSSFQPDALTGVRTADARAPCALLLDRFRDGWFETARSLDCIAVVTDYEMMDAALIARLHGAGLRGLVYTVNDSAEAQRVIQLGVDGVITDAIDMFAPTAGVASHTWATTSHGCAVSSINRNS
jgi:glycerophosphoryl diester phosphodiesterase